MSYLNGSRYMSQEEPYTPLCYPSLGSIIKTQPSIDMDIENPSTEKLYISPKEITPIPEETWDTLGELSSKFDFLVKHSAPLSSQIFIKDIVPTG